MPKAQFQTFSTRSRPDLSAARLKSLRSALQALGAEGLLLPRADIFQGEYLPPSEDRLAWLTGFTGSAGFAIVLKDRAALFVDGRYTVQGKAETDPAVVSVVPLAETSPEDWLRREGKPGARIAYDPALFTARGLKRFESAAADAALALVALKSDPFDPIWEDRPAAPASDIVDHAEIHAGESAEAKIRRLQEKMAELKLDSLVVSECPSVNWLFNFRAGDVPHLPILRAFALVPREGKPVLFVDAKRLAPDLARRLARSVEIVTPATAPGDGRAELSSRLRQVAASGARIRLDEESAPVLLTGVIEEAGGRADAGTDPIALMKAVKNDVEIEGSRKAHSRDGVAVTRFLNWLDTQAPKGQLTEIDAVIALENFRKEAGDLADISFPSISAAGPNAALPHYRVTEASNRKITQGLFLIDSGAQFRDGTTDITRTIAIGKTTKAMREAFTRVLKGMIAISLAVFPKGTSGAQLDSFARQFLWQAGQDFDHGTGHGVGSFLSVHEGPQRISKLGTTPLQPGMMLSNEPGYYREGHFGIRIENLVVVEKRVIKGGEREMYGFETLTFAPIDRRLIVKSMLTKDERNWLDAYHAETLKRIGKGLKGADLAFLEAACAPL
ncbi:MAG: aminopeptidase P family protein [Proteobacteria bacterium]|nr:aminopeptidase P family protein [Pseudomonadota bacterium]